MALNKKEALILEALKNALGAKDLGLNTGKETSHFQQFKFEDIQNMMFLKVNDSPFANAIMAAFRKVHSYKYIQEPSFGEAFQKELKAMSIPMKEQRKALNSAHQVMTEMSKDEDAEQDFGWNPNMKDLVDVTTNADNRKPERSIPFNNKENLRATEIDADYKQI